MSEDKTLGVEVIKTVLSNPQSWLFVLVLVVIGGGIWQSNTSRQDRQEVMEYMRNWLLTHITTTDRVYVRTLKEAGVE